MKGKLIVFEGIDGVGKTTQLRRLDVRLQQQRYKTCVISTPGTTCLGLKIRRLVKEELHLGGLSELFLFAADRAHVVQNVVIPALSDGQIVLCDRFTASTIAYQGFGRGGNITDIELINELSALGITPDLTLWFDCAPELAFARTKPDSMSPDLEFLTQVREGYRRQFTFESNRSGWWEHIDTSGDELSVHAQVIAAVDAYLIDWAKKVS